MILPVQLRRIACQGPDKRKSSANVSGVTELSHVGLRGTFPGGWRHMIARDAEEDVDGAGRFHVIELRRRAGRADVVMFVGTVGTGARDGGVRLSDEELLAALAAGIPGAQCEVASLTGHHIARCRGVVTIEGSARPCLAYRWIVGAHVASVQFLYFDAPTYAEEREADAIVGSLEPL